MADLNNDGRLDLAVSNGLSNSISVLLNTTTVGSSTVSFGPRQDFAVGARPRSVVATDLNGDGRQDLIIANIDSDTVSVFFNLTSPGAAAVSLVVRQDIVVADGPTALAVADFNGDGRPDLAVANANTNTASVLLNTTNLGTTIASFAARQDLTVGPGPRGIVAADVNADGRPDLVVSNSNSETGSTVSTLLNNTAAGAAAPAFAAKQDSTVGTGPIAVATGDVNGDGRLDFVVAIFGSNNLSVMLNQTSPGSATASYLISSVAAGVNPIYVAVGDVNGDGREDITSANAGSDTASVFINTPFVITQGTATGTIQDDDAAPLVSFSPIATALAQVRWQPVAISAAAIASDPNLADKRSFDLIITTTSDWLSAGLQVTMPGGATFYNHPLGGNTAPTPGDIVSDPARAFDTYVSGPGGTANPPFVLGAYPNGATPIFDPTNLSVAWGDLISSTGGVYQLARLTFSASALIGTDLVLDSSKTSVVNALGGSAAMLIPEIFQGNSVAENAGTVNLPFFFAGASAANVTISASVIGGSATSGVDYTGPASVIVAPGSTAGNLSLTILDDNIDEPNELIELRLNNPAGSLASGTILGYVTIIDNEPMPTVQFGSPSLTIGEAGGTANISVTLSGVSSQNVTIPYSVTGGTAVTPGDFTIPSGPFVIPAGSTGGSISVSIVNDTLDEADETVILTLGVPTNAALGAPSSHTLTIADDDPMPSVRFASASASVGEAVGTYVLTVELSAASGRDVTVPLVVDAGSTASTPADYFYSPSTVLIPAGSTSGTTTVTIIDDPIYELTETVLVSISSPTNAAVGLPSQFTLSITDNDVPPLVSFSPITASPLSVRWQPVAISAAAIANDPALADMVSFDLIATTTMDWISAGVEVTMPAGTALYNNALGGETEPSSSGISGNPALAFDTYVTGPGGATNPPLVLGAYPAGPTASFGPTLFSVSWGDVATSPAGQYRIARLTFSQAALNSPDIVTDSSRATQTGSPVLTTIPVPEIYRSQSVAESIGALSIPVFLNAAAAVDITISATITGGTALVGTDFTGPVSVIIPAGATSGNLILNVTNDLFDEPNETIDLRLNNPVGSAASGTLVRRVTITDDDLPPTVSFAGGNFSSSESAGNVSFTVQLSAPSGFDITVPFTGGGVTATAGVDFTQITTSPIVIPAGATSGFITVAIVDDALDEFDETLSFTLGSPTNATLSGTQTQQLTILDNDLAPTVQFSLTGQTFGEGAGQVSVQVNLSAASGKPISLFYTSASGTASIPGDLVIAASPLLIPAGATTANILVDIVDDGLVETNETRVITLASSPDVVIGSPASYTLTIADNDVPPQLLSSAFEFETAQRVKFGFSANVGASLSPSDLLLQNLTQGGTIVPPAAMSLTYSGPAGSPPNIASFVFPGVPGGILPDGNYRATIQAGNVTDNFGNPLTANIVFDFFVFAGDANHDRNVNLDDFTRLAANFGRPATFSQGDFDYTGFVDLDDFSILASRFGQTLVASPPPASLPAARMSSPLADSALIEPIRFEGIRFGSQLIEEVIDLTAEPDRIN